ncbi:hypothetical protein SCHPADRAFT_123842 [Schizopora paradoxa]|uniref:CBF1-interacting co-repressor CIR N-terminal domain-containing protein n=1 Tax=Schizopora paradoxa TaxID=27342 RepID=A0A0H2SMW1_9AGAM|nr:hypothetical protein SCHPADRAFT_123842 [Schizopora paradoxa]
MGKLNIAHHKSYHPYRRDNIERVRRDEEAARLKEEQEEGRMMVADAEARINLLRERAETSKKGKRRLEEEKERELLTKSTNEHIEETAKAKGHINFFEDLEMSSIAGAIQRSREADKLAKRGGKDGKAQEDEKGVPLAPSAKDLKPWYSAKDINAEKEKDDDRRSRDDSHKSRSDPLTSINRQLAARYSSSDEQQPRFRHPSTHSSSRNAPMAPPSSSSEGAGAADARQARLQRESAERRRALELKERRRREAAGSMTPSTTTGGYEYGDQFNRREVQEAHRNRGSGWRDGRERTW